MADKIDLMPEEERIYIELQDLVKQSQKFYQEFSGNFDIQRDRLNTMSELSHDLHMKLKERGHEPIHHRYMYENRGVPVENIEFYNHLHPVEDLLKYVEDPDSNKDPEDSTIGETFEFNVFTRRWGHYDPHKLLRTQEGWEIVQGIVIERKANKKGEPAIFSTLNHDSISYPRTTDIFLEWIWNKASEGATKEEVQKALNDLAEWISLCEQSTPQGFFEGLI